MPERDRTRFLRRNLAVVPVEGLAGIKLYLAHKGSGLSRLGDAPPYWAYVWAGGAALAQYVLATPDLVRGKRVMDFGAGSGIVAMAAARAGACEVLIWECDPWGRAAVLLNAGLNAVDVAFAEDLVAVDVVLCGDVFYSAEVALKAMDQLDALHALGARVLVGDPGRADLPRDRLVKRAEVAVRDMGDPPGADLRLAGIYDYVPAYSAAKAPALPGCARPDTKSPTAASST